MSWFGKTGSISRDEMIELVRRAADEAKRRIAALEAELAEARKDAERARSLASRAEKAVDEAIKEKDAVASFSVGTNADINRELITIIVFLIFFDAGFKTI